MSETILITGSTGMVGRNLLQSLTNTDYKILNPRRSELDLTNAMDVANYFKSNKIDIVIHAAGLVGGIQANIKKPYSFLTINAQIGLNVINACVETRVQKVINLASSCMYPKDCDSELTEDMILTGPLEPTNEGYALAKIITTKMCEYAFSQFHLDYKTIIPCNLYGEYDNFDPIYSHMIPAVIRKVHHAKISNSKVEVWGTGNVRREFMYVGDLVDFIKWSMDYYEKIPRIINVGLGYDYSIKEYYQTISEVIGYTGGFIFDISKPEGMNRKLCSVKKQVLLGWKPKNSLRQGIEKTYNFYLKNHAI